MEDDLKDILKGKVTHLILLNWEIVGYNKAYAGFPYVLTDIYSSTSVYTRIKFDFAQLIRINWHFLIYILNYTRQSNFFPFIEGLL